MAQKALNILDLLPPGWLSPPFERERLSGDGGHRIYVRIKKGGKSRMLALCGPSDPGLKDFIRIGRLLKKADVRIPAVYKTDQKKGLLLLEDLGDMTLERLMRERGQKAAMPLYRRALAAAARFQERVPPPGPRFGKDFFMREAAAAFKNMEALRRLLKSGSAAAKEAAAHLKEAGPAGPLKASPGQYKGAGRLSSPSLSHKTALARAEGAAPPKEFLRDMARISSQLEKEPYVFCHRDFHSRNLMALRKNSSKEEELAVIDFQDAGAGPLCYDLTSLFYDSYVFLGEEAQKELLLFYWDGLGEPLKRASGSLEKTRAAVRRQFLQRGFKACGCFAGFYVNEGRGGHLKFLSGTLKRLEREADLLSYKHIKSAVRSFHQSFFAEGFSKKPRAYRRGKGIASRTWLKPPIQAIRRSKPKPNPE